MQIIVINKRYNALFRSNKLRSNKYNELARITKHIYLQSYFLQKFVLLFEETTQLNKANV